MSEKSKPLHSVVIPTADLVGMVAARVLNGWPEHADFRYAIEFTLVPGKGLRVDIYPAPQG